MLALTLCLLPNRTENIEKKTDYQGLLWLDLSQFVCQLQICRRRRARQEEAKFKRGPGCNFRHISMFRINDVEI